MPELETLCFMESLRLDCYSLCKDFNTILLKNECLFCIGFLNECWVKQYSLFFHFLVCYLSQGYIYVKSSKAFSALVIALLKVKKTKSSEGDEAFLNYNSLVLTMNIYMFSVNFLFAIQFCLVRVWSKYLRYHFINQYVTI